MVTPLNRIVFALSTWPSWLFAWLDRLFFPTKVMVCDVAEFCFGLASFFQVALCLTCGSFVGIHGDVKEDVTIVVVFP